MRPGADLEIPEGHVKTCVGMIKALLVFISWNLYFYLCHSVTLIYGCLCKYIYIRGLIFNGNTLKYSWS